MGGPIPVPRTFHSSSSFSEGRQELVVFSGGESGTSPVADNSIHIFNQSKEKEIIIILTLNFAVKCV